MPAELEIDCESPTLQLFAITRDLSPQGAFVSTVVPLEPGTRVHLRLSGPGLGADPNAHVALAGEVAWLRPYRPEAPNAGPPGLGIRFVDVDDRTRQVLTRLVRHLAHSGV